MKNKTRIDKEERRVKYIYATIFAGLLLPDVSALFRVPFRGLLLADGMCTSREKKGPSTNEYDTQHTRECFK